MPESYNGLGYLNLIGMIFEIEVIMSDFRKDNKPNERPADINLLFIEEPEAHTHPQMQYVFIQNIKEILEANCCNADGEELMDMQSIISTHSAHIVSKSDFDDIKYFYIADDRYAYAKNMTDLEIEYKKDNKKGKDNEEKNIGTQRYKFLKQYLTLHRTELFFADKAVFVEGDTERILLPAMMQKIDQEIEDDKVALLSQNISVIEVGAYSHIFSRFIEFIGIKSLIITDLDPAEIVEVKNGDGTPKLKKDGTPKKETQGCKVSDKTTETTNAALKFFFASILAVNKKTDERQFPTDFSILSTLSSDMKNLKSDKDNNWQQSSNGNVFVAFQTQESDFAGVPYQACSFEDSFIHINKQFIIDNLEVFQSLKKINKFDNEKEDAYDLANSCVDKKTSFAMEILLASSTNKVGKDYSNWRTPNYIEEGLKWLGNQ